MQDGLCEPLNNLPASPNSCRHPRSSAISYRRMPHAAGDAAVSIQEGGDPPALLYPLVVQDSSASKQGLHDLSIVIEYLIRVLQDGIDDPDLPARIADARAWGGSHQRRPEYDGQILRAHPSDVRVVYHTVQMQGEGSESGIVGVRQAIDDGVQRVAADDFVVVF